MTHSGGQPHSVGDEGQRYEITYFDPDQGVRKVFGWATIWKVAVRMSDSIDLHPSMTQPLIRDRQLEGKNKE